MALRHRYRTQPSRLIRPLAILIALALGAGLIWTMQSAFSVGHDMIRSVDESKLEARMRAEERAARREEMRITAVPSTTKMEDPGPLRALSGRVVFPPGTPADEDVSVVLYDELDSKIVHDRQRLGPDRSFRLGVPANIEVARVSLQAHYLFLDVCVHVVLDDLSSELVLEPKLGGRVLGECRVPAQRLCIAPWIRALDVYLSSVSDAPGTHVQRGGGRKLELPAYTENSEYMNGRTATFDAQLGFECGGVLPGVPCEFQFFHGPHLLEAMGPVRVAPGETTRVELRLVPLVLIEGIVVDEKSKPLAGATCALDDADADQGVPTTDSAGRFCLPARSDGVITILARLEGYHDTRLRMEDTVFGTDRTDLRLTMRRIRPPVSSIEGRVVWEDGSPAGGAFVLAEPSEGSEVDPHLARSDSEGRFMIERLEAGLFDLNARARTFVAVTTSDDESEGENPRRWGVAHASQVSTDGKTPVELRLGAGARLRGRVIDDEQQPIPAFRLSARAAGAGLLNELPAFDLADTFHDPAGRFEIAGLHPGSWDIQASCGSFRSALRRIEITEQDASIEVLLTRRGALYGSVVDEQGKPMPRIDVVLFDTRTSRDGKVSWFTGSDKRTSADEEGRFSFPSCPRGDYFLMAGRDAGPCAGPDTIHVDRDRALEAHRLEVRPLGSAHGTVLDELGRPVHGAEVHLQSQEPWTSFWHSGHADVTGPEGNFTFERVYPGQYKLFAYRGGQSTGAVPVEVTTTEGAALSIELKPKANPRR
jgi:hypothetical protein